MTANINSILLFVYLALNGEKWYQNRLSDLPRATQGIHYRHGATLIEFMNDNNFPA